MMLAAAAAALALSLPFPNVVHASLHGVAHRSFHQVAHASLQGRDDSTSEVQLHDVQLQNCPLACEYATSDTSTWTTYHSFDELSFCNDTILFTLNVQASTETPLIKACLTSPSGPQMQAGAFYGLIQNNVTSTPSPEMIPELVVSEGKMVTSQDGSCGASPQETTLAVETRWSGQGSASADKVSDAVSQLQEYFRKSASCGRDLMFARSSVNVVVGAFAGGDILKSSVADLIDAHSESILQGTLPARFAMQTTGTVAQNGSTAQAQFDTRLGFFADLTGNVTSVQGFLAGYINSVSEGIDLQDMEGGKAPVLTSVIILGSTVTSNATTSGRSVQPRALCRDIQVIKDDSCASLASRCGISGSDFTKYNSKTSNLCATLKPKQYVCCSQGDLPDHTPQPSGDGTCFTYEVKADDGCWSIADSFGIDTKRIEEVNKKTWGFAGCSTLKEKAIICLSKGNPPMPAQDPSIICGPQVVGTQRPANWDDIAKLNPCPLNACCDVWGQCGTTDEFCTRSDVDDEHIGTAKPNTNGCISNCGTKITNNNAGPAQFARVGYFEAFNVEGRSCLNMDVTQMDTDKYTHIHFAFATISKDYKVAMTDGVKEQFDKMVAMDTTAKKILSFGGWSFSTDHDTSPIFATGVTDANRELFATNVVQFLKDNKLDGLDFDWEYPGATDIEGSVPGSPSDGLNYLKFLKSVKSKLPPGKTVSIALPASYWYLKGFPVKLMSAVVDYFIYMTYDLHGQWDYGSKFSNPGCKTGNCLRSHVNKTETQTALSMVTKAGVPSNKIMVGVSSYGRSFKMLDAGCTSVTCKFTGSPKVSNAEPGMCTKTSGYIADAEIQALIEADEVDGTGSVKTWFDDASDSNIMTWNGNWVAYMDAFTKYTRIEWVKELNFGGTTDWAVDLQEFQDPIHDGDDEDDEDIDNAEDEDCIQEYANLDALVDDLDNVASVCAAEYAIGTMSTLLDATLKKYDEIKNDYDGKFGYYAGYIDELVNPQLENWMYNFAMGEENKTGLGNKYFDCKYERDGNKYSGPCPVPYDIMNKDSWSSPDEWGLETWTIEYTLRDKDGYEKALSKDLGISPDWIVFKDTDTWPECEGAPDDCVEVHQWHRKDYPRKKDHIDVPDPKKIMEDALPTIQALKTQMSEAVMLLGFDLYDAEYDGKDAIYALATPVQMLAQAVDTMAQVKDIGGKISAQKKKETILLIVSLILMIVPFVSELGFAVAGLSNLARLAFVAGEVANGAQAVYEIIDDPESAPFAVMGILAGAAGKSGKLEMTFSDASAARRVLTDAGAMGKRFKEVDDKYQKVMGRCTV